MELYTSLWKVNLQYNSEKLNLNTVYAFYERNGLETLSTHSKA